MRPPRRTRALTEAESRLWNEIARLVTPLRGRARPKLPEPEAATAKPVAKPAKSAAKPAGKVAVKPPANVPVREGPVPGASVRPSARLAAPTMPPYQAPPPVPPPATGGLERRARIGLKRGTLPVEARIDLHGLYQAEAHAALVGFLMRCRAAGHAHVLVVTGKGGPSFDDAFSERGVLRRSVPHWLRGPDLRGLVLGFEEAARHHGGSGALYVRLRRR
ncbi:Smr/MutS family protein [Methylobacterium durans]|uniref:Smr/MutS family protein n=1 Tax=Methylobacterium durans TaxID=2202825 RepID=UPI002AFF0B88|nr:Smr/MutS family protein [Methylobacterium durans]MEA1831156.1 Smr/MutS family protein [Methylobacterium durans]